MNTILLRHVNIVDSAEGVRREKNVLIEDGKIKSIFGNSETFPEAERILDLDGKYLAPGLIDMHVHMTAEAGKDKSGMSGGIWRMCTPSPLKAMHFLHNARKAMMSGFTTLRNCGHTTYYTPEDVAVRDAVNKDLVEGPNIVACAGYITMTAGHGDLSINRNVRRLPEFNIGDRCFNGVWGCVEGVREKVRHGADFIKVMASGGMGSSGDEPEWPNYTVEELTAIVDEAHSLYKKVAAHTHSTEASRRCIEAGIDTIEHGCGLNDEMCEKMAEKGLFLIPTMLVVNRLLESDDKEERAKAQKMAAIHDGALYAALRNGVKIGYGTDTINALKHGENGLEILSLQQYGMSSRQIFGSMTAVSAQALGREKEIGLVREGMNADLIAVDENPLEKVETLAYGDNIKVVIVNGRVVKNV